jgi:hypothetical protein
MGMDGIDRHVDMIGKHNNTGITTSLLADRGGRRNEPRR